MTRAVRSGRGLSPSPTGASLIGCGATSAPGHAESSYVLPERAGAGGASAPPLVRAMLWLAFAGLVIALIVMGHGLRPDLTQRLHQPAFAVTAAAALATGILSAIAAFVISLPDRSRWWLMLPVPALAAWMSTIGYRLLTDLG